MSLLERVIRGHRCRSTHHYIAMDALSLIATDDAEMWKDLFLVHHEHLLAGAKAPDSTFKDFKNHVLHVSEGEWGGAPGKAMEWYANSVEHLRKKQWSKAAYALGVLSHYYADPIQPFHTGQTEEEGAIHRAVEWSIAKSRDKIDGRIATIGYPDVPVPDGIGFVADMVRNGARLSHEHYQTFIDHYDLDAGVKDPPSGLDETMFDAIVDLVAYATAGFGAILTRAIREAAVSAPKTHLTLQGYIETLDIPIRWVTAKLSDAADRHTVTRMYKEFQKAGKVIRTLPEDDKVIRKLHASQVLRTPLKELNKRELGPIGSKNKAVEERLLTQLIEDEAKLNAAEETAEDIGAAESEAEEILLDQPVTEETAEEIEAEAEDPEEVPAPKKQAPPKAEEVLFEPEEASAETQAPTSEEDYDDESGDIARRSRITRDSPVVEAPSIGKKTAKRLGRAGITTVGDLLDCDLEETVFLLDVAYIDVDRLNDWKDQTILMMEVPGLRVHDAQILVGAGIRNRAELADAPARTLFMLASEFLQTPEGDRVIRDDDYLAEEEVNGWIEMAKTAA
ncbi:MAG: DUF4332 domain-containing protein [Alphaproteobacteria bacterium]|nr:hypothetical protein [Hyphomonas sp.]MBR9806771.1 DUF4332 domain-containing protein [Alphaproteobacteria bacterium]|tara:strand:- start:767 stop:2458 length:1692 start_codon:yes stop_codon:yes gene_type:complete